MLTGTVSSRLRHVHAWSAGRCACGAVRCAGFLVTKAAGTLVRCVRAAHDIVVVDGAAGPMPVEFCGRCADEVTACPQP